MASLRRSPIELLVALAVAALFLPPWPAAVAVAGIAFFWARRARQRSARLPVLAGLLTALIALLLAAAVAWLPDLAAASWRSDVETAYRALWAELEEEAARAVTVLPSATDVAGRQRQTFELLRALDDRRQTTHILLDPDGEAFAWGGEGLLHEPVADELPRRGLAYRRGFTAVTLFVVSPLDEARRPWRLVSGRSLSTEAFTNVDSALARQLGRWSIAPPSPEADARTRIEPQGLPALVFEQPPQLGRWRRQALSAAARRAAAAVLAVIAWALVVRSSRRLLAGDGDHQAFERLAIAGLVAAFVTATALAFELSPVATAVLLPAVALASWALLRPRGTSSIPGEVLGACVMLALAAGAWLLVKRLALPDLAAGFGGGAEILALRLAGCLTALALLLMSVARRRSRPPGDLGGWVAIVTLAVAAAASDLPWLALPLVASTGALSVRWLSGLDLRAEPMALGALLLIAAFSGAVIWETVFRLELRHELGTRYLAAVETPTPTEINRLHLEFHQFFADRDIARMVPPGTAEVDIQDLAFVLWRASPLPQRDALSALIVESDSGESSSFAFGLSLDEDLELIWEPSRWHIPLVPAWQDALAFGEVELTRDGAPWGRVRYWFLPRPGFRLEVSEIEELEVALLRVNTHRRPIDGLPDTALFALYSADRQAITAPWEEMPPLAGEVDGRGQVVTPSGRCWYWTRSDGEVIEALYLPVLGPLAALERVGTHALGSLLLIVVVLLLALFSSLPRVTLRAAVRRTVRSYSRRLMLVYTVLLLLPLVALNLVLLHGFEERMREEQQAAGEAALASARLFLIDYILGIEPGFGIDTRLNRELLEWISSVVQHQVNLYWGSEIYTSSQQELFTAGLLPKRIPGEIFSRLALFGYELGSRTQMGGASAYREIYAPLKLPGVTSSRQRIFISVPLLEQEEEVTRELATLRRQAVLASTALFLLLLAVGSRLARSFTTPLQQLVEGTDRIAAGATSLAIRPRVLELSAIAEAIDDMARRLAEGRRRLVREKQVVERIVDNITSGVVSLDAARRVLLHNRVAVELLGTRPGEAIERALAEREHLLPVRELLDRIGGGSHRQTLRLVDEDGHPRDWTITWVQVGSEALLVVDDVTEVLRGQRLEAWLEMARIIAHEVKNPLTPIQLSTEHLQQVYRSAPERLAEIFERCTGNILKQVEELRDIASDFSLYSRIPRAELRRDDLIEAMRELARMYGDASSGGVTIHFTSDRETLVTRFDRKLLGRAVRNLLENALRASGAAGTVELAVDKRGAEVSVRVADGGPGVRSEILSRIFDPYFSTHEAGTGLGLPIVRRVVEEHGGRVEARNRPQGGFEVEMTLPLSTSPEGDASDVAKTPGGEI